MKPEIIEIQDRSDIITTNEQVHRIAMTLALDSGLLKSRMVFENWLTLDDIEDLELHYTNLVTQLQNYRKSVQGEE